MLTSAEVMMIGTPAKLRSQSLLSKLKSLSVILDSRLSFDGHVTMECKTYHYLMAFWHIRRLLPFKVACFVVGARWITVI